MIIENYLNQDYDFLKKINLDSNTLYCDETFGGDSKSLFLIKPPKIKEIVWKRPHEIAENPQFIIDGINSGDLDQGKLGNCWFITAISNITSIESFCKFIIPNSSQQTFTNEDYAGIFKFRYNCVMLYRKIPQKCQHFPADLVPQNKNYFHKRSKVTFLVYGVVFV